MNTWCANQKLISNTAIRIMNQPSARFHRQLQLIYNDRNGQNIFIWPNFCSMQLNTHFICIFHTYFKRRALFSHFILPHVLRCVCVPCRFRTVHMLVSVNTEHWTEPYVRMWRRYSWWAYHIVECRCQTLTYNIYCWFVYERAVFVYAALRCFCFYYSRRDKKEKNKNLYTLACDDVDDDDDGYGYGYDDDVLLFSFWRCPVAAVLSLSLSLILLCGGNGHYHHSAVCTIFWWLLFAGGIFYFITFIWRSTSLPLPYNNTPHCHVTTQQQCDDWTKWSQQIWIVCAIRHVEWNSYYENINWF